ncbi:prepilin-type N-terminal cleavage/methylation domain-containing protein [Geosporobacter ferrireducens]
MDKRNSGFTLTELEIAIAILGIIAAIARPRWTRYKSLSEDSV